MKKEKIKPKRQRNNSNNKNENHNSKSTGKVPFKTSHQNLHTGDLSLKNTDDKNQDNTNHDNAILDNAYKDNANKEKANKDRTNRDIMRITYLFAGLFLLVIGYFTVFMIRDSAEVINNPYNKRQDLLAKRVIRGEIRSADGKILAYTKIGDDGEETRVYPYGSVFSHVVGRFLKGRSGVESTENFHLLTSSTSPINHIFSELSGEKVVGDNIITTLDTKVQEVAHEALGNYKGAILVMEPSSGKILAMVSKPDYDPNEINNIWEGLLEDNENDSTLLNRTTQGLYPPGSIFKILTALEYIIENPDYNDFLHNCKGEEKFDGVTIQCNHKIAHGDVDLKKALAKSCNVSFSKIGTMLDLSSFRKLCDGFLFNSPLPTGLYYNESSFVLGGSSDKKEIPQTVIGQGKTLITPLHSALITSTIANGGVMMKPYVIDRIVSTNGSIVKKYMPEKYKSVITPNQAEILTELMTEVVINGTGKDLKNNNYTAAGKTGSAEYQEDKPAHAWFVGFAPAEKPEVVVSVVVESVGTGSEYAVPIAKKIFDVYFDK